MLYGLNEYNQLKFLTPKEQISLILEFGLYDNKKMKIQDISNILNIKDKKAYLIDNKNNKYLLQYDDFTHIFNHSKINLIDKLNKIKGFGTYRIELLNESIAETQSIINKIKDML